MNTWNKRNGQRATVKRPGTKQYDADYKNRESQFYQGYTTGGCKSCGSTEITANGGNGRLFVYCAKCGKQLKVLNTKPTKVGAWSAKTIYRSRAGLCLKCGNGSYRGKMHITKDGKHYSIQLYCGSCGYRNDWHNI